MVRVTAAHTHTHTHSGTREIKNPKKGILFGDPLFGKNPKKNPLFGNPLFGKEKKTPINGFC